MPRTPGLYEGLWMRQNDLRADHPLAYQAAKTAIGSAIPVLPTVLAVANAYQRWKHGMPLFGDTLGKLGGAAQDMFSGMGSHTGGPLSSTPQHPLYDGLYTNGISGGGGAGSGGPSQPNTQLPNYPAIQSMSAHPIGLGDLGGYWNQVAIHDAAPTYGPFAGYGKNPLPIAPSGIFGA